MEELIRNLEWSGIKSIYTKVDINVLFPEKTHKIVFSQTRSVVYIMTDAMFRQTFSCASTPAFNVVLYQDGVDPFTLGLDKFNIAFEQPEDNQMLDDFLAGFTINNT